jgi:hypothetical protein
MFRRPRKSLPGSERLAALPAPTGGLNAFSPAMGMPPTDCMVLRNMLAADNGLRARLGWREHVTGMTGASDDLVRTFIPYTGSSTDATRAFATTSSGIWDVSDSGSSPSLVLAFADTSGDAGYGVSHAHTTTAGNFIWYADEQNGLHLYTESTDTWAAVSALSITGVDPADLVFVMSWKGFTLFAERGSTDIWILPVNSISGAASRLGVGYKLQAGGDIVGMYSWTGDGGAGLDDLLVVVTRGGDVLLYQGTDPTDSTLFGNVGVWGVGKMPAGRRLAVSYGRQLVLLTRSGVVSMESLRSGQAGAAMYETAKVQNLFNKLMLSRGDVRGWDLVVHPEEAALIVLVPVSSTEPTTQLAMSLATRSWSELSGLDIYSCAAHEGKLYFGTTDGRICINDGNVDGLELADPNTFTGIEFSGITAFQNMGTGAKKQVHLIRPYFMSEATRPTFTVNARYDFSLTELDAVAYQPAESGDVWDTGLWDSMLWGGLYSTSTAVRGSAGIGANVAIAWRGVSVDRTVLTGFELSYSTGGML